MAQNTENPFLRSFTRIINKESSSYQNGVVARRGEALTARLLSLMLVLVLVLVAGILGAWAQSAPDKLTGLGSMQVLAILSIAHRCPGGAPASSQLNTAALAGAAGLDAFDNAVRTDVAHGQASVANPVAGRPSLLVQNLYVYGLNIMYIYDATWMARESIANGEGGRITASGYPKNIPGWENRRRTFFAWFYLRQFKQVQGDPLVTVDKVPVRCCRVFHNDRYDVWGFSFTCPATGQYSIQILPNSSEWEFRSLTVSRYAVAP